MPQLPPLGRYLIPVHKGHEFEQAPGIGDGQRSLAEKAVAPHSCTLAWKIPWIEEPGRLQSMESLSRTRLSD